MEQPFWTSYIERYQTVVTPNWLILKVGLEISIKMHFCSSIRKEIVTYKSHLG